MIEARPSFFSRVILSWIAAWRTLVSPDFAAGVVKLREPQLPAPSTPEPAATPLSRAPEDAALQLLGLLQRKGRLVDFLMEDIQSFSDAEVGAAARVVHTECRKALAEHVQLAPVHDSQEETAVTVEPGYDAAKIRLTGNVHGEGPFRGTLKHRGWCVSEVELPQVAKDHDLHVLAPAEVEL